MSCCRYPTKCCTAKYTEPELPDECRCGRGANNGIVQVLVGQLFLFAGLWSSAATIGDCGLVKLAEPLLVRADNVTTTSIGLLSYFDPASGRCYYWGEDEILVDDSLAIKEISSGSINAQITGIAVETTMNGNEQLEYYLRTVLGEDWYVPMGLLFTSFGLAVIMFLYGTSFYCSTQVKACRCFAGIFVGVLMCLLQMLGTIFIYTSDWCKAEATQCQIHRDTWFSIAATCAFLFAGICFWTMEHWPGQQVLDELEDHRSYDSEEGGYPRKKKPKKESSHRLHSSSSSRRSSAAHQYSKKDRSKHKNQPRSFSGNAWVIEVEKSAAETSRDDLEDYEEYGGYNEYHHDDNVEEPPEVSRPPPRRQSQSNKRSSKMKQVGNVGQQQRKDDYYHVDEEQPPQRHRDRERRDRYNDEPPQSPYGGKRRSSTTKKPRRSSHHRNNHENSLYGHQDPSGMVVDATNSTYADHEESAHIETQNPTYDD